MLIPILRTAQARVSPEQPPECGRVSGVGGAHGLPNCLALLVVEFQWLNHKTIDIWPAPSHELVEFGARDLMTLLRYFLIVLA
jgi:hypothetical protein